MKLSFDVTIDDIVAFNKFHYQNTPALKRQQWCSGWIFAVLIFLIVFLANTKIGLSAKIMPAAFITGLFLIVWPYLFWRGVEHEVRKLFADDLYKGALGRHEIELSDDGFKESTEFGNQFTKWSGVAKIGSDDQYTFVYIGPCLAHIIPKNHIKDGDYQSTVQRLKEKFDKFQ